MTTNGTPSQQPITPLPASPRRRPGHRLRPRSRLGHPGDGSPRSPRSRLRRAAALCLAALTMSFGAVALSALPASAAEISTDYPVVNVQAGQDVTLNLDLSATKLERVGLSVAQAPDGWNATLQGGGFTIGGVYVGPEQTPAVSLHVHVPQDAQTGDYHVKIDADSPSGTETLDVEIDVVKKASGAYQLTSQFDKLQGSTTDTFNFSLTVANNTGADASFGLTAQGPQGWTVTAAPSNKNQASAVDVKAGSTSTVSVTATPPAKVSEGTYPLVVVAESKGVTLKKKLSVEVVGSPTLKLQTANQVLGASGSAGSTTDIHLVVSNTGTAPMTDVNLSSSPPTDWKVTFDRDTIDSIAPGKTANVVAHITPTGDAITGDYQVSISANGQSTNDSINIRYTVSTSSWWGLVGIVVIVVAVVVLLWLFRRYGRR